MTMSYDKDADVLYVEFESHDAPDCLYEEATEGVVYRVTPSGRVVGVTIIGFETLVNKGGHIAMPVRMPDSGLRLATA